MAKVLITDGVHQLLITGLEDRNYEVDYQPNIKLDEVHAIISDYEGIIINTKTVIDRSLLDKATQLKFIGRLGSGLEIIDLEYTQEKGVYCFNTPEGNRNAVAEHALGLILNLFNNINISANEVASAVWNREENRGEELEGKTVGIIGYGNTGQSFAKKLRGFDVEVLGYDKFKSNFGNEFVKEVQLEEVYKKADVLSLHLPLTDDTFNWLDEARINSFEKDFYVINTSRGKVLKQADLLKYLQKSKILGAGLDVLENEKLATFDKAEKYVFEGLNSLKNVIITPHIAGWTHQSKLKIAQVILDNIDCHNVDETL